MRKTQHQEKEKKENKSRVLVPSLGTTSILTNLWAQILALQSLIWKLQHLSLAQSVFNLRISPSVQVILLTYLLEEPRPISTTSALSLLQLCTSHQSGH